MKHDKPLAIGIQKVFLHHTLYYQIDFTIVVTPKLDGLLHWTRIIP